jgi:leucyl aminopeptidase
MDIQVRSGDPATTACDLLVAGVPAGDRVPRALRALDRALGGAIGEALASGDFAGKPGERFRLRAEGARAKRVLLLGLGEEAKLDAEGLRRFAASAVRAAMERKAPQLALCGPPPRRLPPADVGGALAEGAILGGYRFDKYRTLEDPPGVVEGVQILASDAGRTARLRSGGRVGRAIGESTAFARDLSNEPGSVHTPDWLAGAARRMARQVGLKATVFTEKELERHEMGGILAVGRGSANPPRLIVLEHRAPRKGERRRPTVALVGKGITFDSGGISIKPAASMEEMKHDMSGGAAVIGALRAVAALDLPLHVVGIVAAAENKPDGEAYLPGDIVRASSGKTIEVINTDAEGRIVLSDALHHATRFEPDAIVDLATLTGACVVALGSACAGLMGNDEKLIAKLRAAGERSGERVWPLPLWDEHKKMIESHIADIKNVGGREAGTITAAAFLSHFVGETPWVHLDIAGTAWANSDAPTRVKGATGFGVRLLVELLRGWRS